MASMLLMKHGDQLDEEIIHRLQRIQKNVEVESDLIRNCWSFRALKPAGRK